MLHNGTEKMQFSKIMGYPSFLKNSFSVRNCEYNECTWPSAKMSNSVFQCVRDVFTSTVIIVHCFLEGTKWIWGRFLQSQYSSYSYTLALGEYYAIIFYIFFFKNKITINEWISRENFVILVRSIYFQP